MPRCALTQCISTHSKRKPACMDNLPTHEDRLLCASFERTYPMEYVCSCSLHTLYMFGWSEQANEQFMRGNETRFQGENRVTAAGSGTSQYNDSISVGQTFKLLHGNKICALAKRITYREASRDAELSRAWKNSSLASLHN